MPEENELILYTTADGETRLECRFDSETLWLSLNQIAELFGRDKSVISKHLKNIYEDEELWKEATVALFATVQTEGNREVERQIEHYNLEAIFAVGYPHPKILPVRSSPLLCITSSFVYKFSIKLRHTGVGAMAAHT